MSNISKNLLVKGAKGKVGDQFVYKTRGKKTFITSLTTINPNTVATEEKVRVRELFGEAPLLQKALLPTPNSKLPTNKKKVPDKPPTISPSAIILSRLKLN